MPSKKPPKLRGRTAITPTVIRSSSHHRGSDHNHSPSLGRPAINLIHGSVVPASPHRPDAERDDSPENGQDNRQEKHPSA